MQLIPRLVVLAYASNEVRAVLAFAICCKREQLMGDEKAMSERRTVIQHARFLSDFGPFFCPHRQACHLSGQGSGRVLTSCLRFLAVSRDTKAKFKRISGPLNRSAPSTYACCHFSRAASMAHGICRALQEVAGLMGIALARFV